MSNRDFDLDDILSEFKDYEPARQEVPRAPAQPPRQPEMAATARESVYQEPSYNEAGYEEPAYDELAEDESARRPGAEIGPRLRELGQRIRRGCGSLADRLREAAARRGDGEGRTWTAPRWLPVVLTVLLLGLSLGCVRWTLRNVHPGSGTVVSAKPVANLAGRMDHPAGSENELPLGYEADPEDPEAEAPAPAKIHYVIDEDAVVAPAPNPACFGKISIDEPEKVLELIQQARDYGLLGEDETVAFDPSVTFYYDEDIEYYLDETILVICWKEVIDGNTCSFVEIKIADASQLRRKFADDTFASASQYYSTEMHKSTNAVVTLNADFYQNRDFGVVVYGRKLYRFPTSTYTGSYKKYNCLETCFVNGEGDFLFTELGQSFTQEELEQYIADNDILFSISFGPVLVRDGQVQQCDWYPVGEIDKGYSRAGIGQVGKLHYLYMSLNHSPEKAARWTVNEFARHFGEKPVVNAYCLDGGQTGEIVFQGRAYNHVDVVNGQKERPVSDNIYFATAIGGTEVQG